MTKTAVFTMVYNESLFLPIWLHHYGNIFGIENCFVIDDGSNDGSTDDDRIKNLARKNRGELDEDDRALLVSCMHEELLTDYDRVIYTDADELIVIDPSLGTSLDVYLNGHTKTNLTPIGFDVVQRISSEAPLDLSKPLFEQRNYLRFRKDYCKPLISRIPLRWIAGFHESNQPPNYDRNLYLFHLRAIDHDYSKRRIQALNQVRFSENSQRKAHGTHFLWSETEYLQHLYGISETIFSQASEQEPSLFFHENDLRDSSELVRVPARFRNSIMLNSPQQPSTTDGFNTAVRLGNVFLERAIRRAVLDVPGRKRNDPCPCGSGVRLKHCHGACG